MQASRSQYKLLIESSKAGIAQIDLEGKVLIINDVAAGIWMKKSKDLQNKNVKEFLPKEMAIDVMKVIQKITETGKELGQERFIAPINKHFLENIQPIYDNRNEIIGVQVLMFDLTERKQAEEELKSSEERLNILFEYAPDAYFLYDLKGIFIDGNKAAEDLGGIYKRRTDWKKFFYT